MHEKKPRPIRVVMRLCPHCGKVFGPMSDTQWQYVFRAHLIWSLRDNPALYNQTGNFEIH